MKLTYNPEHLLRNYNQDDPWFENNKIAKLVEYFLWEFSNLNAPQELISRMNESWIEYYAELFKKIKAQNILIVGTGFGLLPLLAASKGGTVYACDRYPMLAKIAQEIIEKGETKAIGTINYLFKDIHDIQFGTDIPQKCDMLVFDDFDHSLLETGYVWLLDHLKTTLLTPEAAIFPSKATIYAMFVELTIDSTFFDLNALSKYQWSMGTKPIDLGETKHRILSDSLPVLSLCFQEKVDLAKKSIDFRITNDGMWNAVIYWNDIFKKPKYRVQYVDPVPVKKDSVQVITVHQLKSKVRFTTNTNPSILRNGTTPDWHIGMVNDMARNAPYARAIQRAMRDKKTCTVLDIGSGSGLLSMMVAKANPNAKIYGCEILKTLSESAREIIKNNGYKDQIEIVNCDILKLKLPEEVNFVVHEVIATGLLGEGVLHFLNHAQKFLMKHDATVLPMAAKVKGILVEHRFSDILGFNMESTNLYRYHPDYSSINLNQADHKKLSQPFDVFFFDFRNPVCVAEKKDVIVPVTHDGTLNAVIFWFELFLDEETTLTTSPFAKEKTAWNQAIQYLPTIEVKKNEALPLRLKHDCYKIQFDLMLDKMGAGRQILEQYDEVWKAKFFDVEKRYQELIIHCASNPDDYKTLVDVATKIASDPGSFNIRPKYAVRLAESFFIR